jgi:hypothetical protein
MNDTVLDSSFDALFADLADDQDFPTKKPLLAHYTSLETFEQVLKGKQLWFSNPLLMNDYQEVRWGILESARLVPTNDAIRNALGSEERLLKFLTALEYWQLRFEGEHALDTYIFCFCEHDADDKDGILSMWRGYGNQAGGVAVILNTKKLNGEPNHRLVLARVHYASEEERRDWLLGLLDRFAAIVKDHQLPDEELGNTAWALFERLKMFAIFSKHSGFHEEREWRAAYLPWADQDENNNLRKYLHYQVTATGVHPKLKLPILEIPLADGSECTFEKLVDRIILGPTISTPIATESLKRMLKILGQQELSERVVASGIPFRRV